MDNNAQNQSAVPAPQAQGGGDTQRPLQPPTAPRHPEQGPPMQMREVQTLPEEAEAAATTQAASDVPDTPDTQDTQAPEVQLQESHPQVEVPVELKEAGVEQGPDAEKQQLPEEKQQIEVAPVTPPAEQAPVAAPVAMPHGATMSFEEAVQSEKTEKSTKNSLSWLIREVIREWKKKLQTG